LDRKELVMSKVIQELPRIRRRGRPTKYPWGEWTDGKPRSIVQGEDFNLEPRVMVSALHTHATTHDLAVETRTDDKGVVYFQFSPKEG
jgi:hypothetical protein